MLWVLWQYALFSSNILAEGGIVYVLTGIDTEVVKTWDSPLPTKIDTILTENQ